MGYCIITKDAIKHKWCEFLEEHRGPIDSYFHIIDIMKIYSQPSEREIIGTHIITAKVKEKGKNPEYANVLVGVVEADPTSGKVIERLNNEGNIVALSCPPFVDNKGGKPVELG